MESIQFFSTPTDDKFFILTLRGMVYLVFLDSLYQLPYYYIQFDTLQESLLFCVTLQSIIVTQANFLLGVERQNSQSSYLLATCKQVNSVFQVTDIFKLSFKTKRPHQVFSEELVNILLIKPEFYIIQDNLFPLEFEVNNFLKQPFDQIDINLYSLYLGKLTNCITIKNQRQELFMERKLDFNFNLLEISTNMKICQDKQLILLNNQIQLPNSGPFKLLQRLSNILKLDTNIFTNDIFSAELAGFICSKVAQLKVLFEQQSQLDIQYQFYYVPISSEIPILIKEINQLKVSFKNFERRVFMTPQLCKINQLIIQNNDNIGKISIYFGVQISDLQLVFSGNLNSSYIQNFNITINDKVTNFLIIDSNSSNYDILGIGETIQRRFGFTEVQKSLEISTIDMKNTTIIDTNLPKLESPQTPVSINSLNKSVFYTGDLELKINCKQCIQQEILCINAQKNIENSLYDSKLLHIFGFNLISGGASILNNLLCSEGFEVKTNSPLTFQIASIYDIFDAEILTSNKVFMNGQESNKLDQINQLLTVEVWPENDVIKISNMIFSKCQSNVLQTIIKNKQKSVPVLIQHQGIEKNGKIQIRLKRYSIVTVLDFKIQQQQKVQIEFLKDSEGRGFSFLEHGPSGNEKFEISQVHEITVLTSGKYELRPPVRSRRFNIIGASQVQIFGCEEK
ncbi:hypothetical protein SS50377_26334 [Spironucleus salmonicida]|uniref:Uncharacterized protein n=1 Tax=Spironucleus salmonicida TaxID=348837 RepID=V6LT23_9EUKA|nr:hypothetical protein SS50377_26334 [Spironucleus salmonicida]|eukprot:EST47797.1 Hypothetical protein SS50377_12198 [Spironucleus salmonicida]